MYSLPTSLTIKDKAYQIRNNGDYRVVLDCFSAISDIELSEDEKVLACLIIFYNEFNDIDDIPKDQELVAELVTQMYKFFNCGQDDSVGASTGQKLIDWDGDSHMVMSAINNVAHVELRSVEYCHWWTFMGYYLSVGESVLSTVVSIRHKIVSGKKLEKWENDFRRDNPQYFNWRSKTSEQLELDNYVKSIWNQEGGSLDG